jgi:hypothetical protein
MSLTANSQTSGAPVQTVAKMPENLVGQGARTKVYSYTTPEGELRVARIPIDLNNLHKERNQFLLLKDYFGDHLPGKPRIESVIFDGEELKVVTCQYIDREELSNASNLVSHFNSLSIDERIEFAKSVQSFVDCCKKFYENLKYLPDLIGEGNVGSNNLNFYLLDLNNLSKDSAQFIMGNPRLPALTQYFTNVPTVNDPKLSFFRFLNKGGELEIISDAQYGNLSKEDRIHSFRADVSRTLTYGNLIFTPIDSIGFPIFDRSLYFLYKLEKNICQKTKEQLKQDPFYGALRNRPRSIRSSVVNDIVVRNRTSFMG